MLLISMYMSYRKIACQFDDLLPNLIDIKGCNYS